MKNMKDYPKFNNALKHMTKSYVKYYPCDEYNFFGHDKIIQKQISKFIKK